MSLKMFTHLHTVSEGGGDELKEIMPELWAEMRKLGLWVELKSAWLIC